ERVLAQRLHFKGAVYRELPHRFAEPGFHHDVAVLIEARRAALGRGRDVEIVAEQSLGAIGAGGQTDGVGLLVDVGVVAVPGGMSDGDPHQPTSSSRVSRENAASI